MRSAFLQAQVQVFTTNELLPTSAYIHIPFCRHRCGYCNFSLVAGREDLVDAYLICLQDEFARTLQTPQSVSTLFIGGGTPTALQPQQLEKLFDSIEQWLPLQSSGEYTCEANPLDCNLEILSLLKKRGVNRLSLGGQSFNDSKLKLLERDHSGSQLREITESAASYFRNLSLDLIFAAPGETLEAWQKEVEAALQLPVSHLSTYGLTIERGSKFFGRLKKGELVEVDEDLQLSMYQHTIQRLQDAGWQHYEVSNFCMSGAHCCHNLTYWNGHCWWAFGAGAASFLPIGLLPVQDFRSIDQCQETVKSRKSEPPPSGGPIWQLSTNHRSTTQYMKLVQQGESPVAEREFLNQESWIRQRLVFGLRQLAGIDLAELQQYWVGPVQQLFEPHLSRYIAENWLELTDSRLKLSPAGLVISDSLWPNLLATDIGNR